MKESKRLKLVELLQKPENLKELYAYASFLSNYYKLPPDMEPEDIVHDAIVSLFEGIRDWDDERYLDLLPVMKRIIQSKMSHALKKTDEMRVFPPKEYLENILVECPDDDPVEQLQLRKVRGIIENAIGEDEILIKIYCAIVDGCEKPAAIAKHTGMEITEVRNGLRRLQRNREKIIKKEESHESR